MSNNKKFFMPKQNNLIGQVGRLKSFNKLAYYIAGLIVLTIGAAFSFSGKSNAVVQNDSISLNDKLKSKIDTFANDEDIKPKNIGLGFDTIPVKNNALITTQGNQNNIQNSDDEEVKRVLAQEAKERQEINNEGTSNNINGQNPYTASTRIPVNNISANTPNINMNASIPNMPMLPNIAGQVPNIQDMISGINGGGNDANMQVKKEKFTTKSGNFDYLDSQLQQARSELEIKAGTIIPCILSNSINSDLPGIVGAIVSEDVYDSISHTHIIIPKGTKVNGIYDSNLSFGQNGLATTWNRLVFANGSTFDIGTMTGSDQGGNSGFRDKVNNHYARTFGSAILVALIGSGMQLSQPKGRTSTGNDAQETITANIAQQTGSSGQAVLNKSLNIQPTINIRAGYRFNIMVNKDFVIGG